AEEWQEEPSGEGLLSEQRSVVGRVWNRTNGEVVDRTEHRLLRRRIDREETFGPAVDPNRPEPGTVDDGSGLPRFHAHITSRGIDHRHGPGAAQRDGVTYGELLGRKLTAAELAHRPIEHDREGEVDRKVAVGQ